MNVTIKQIDETKNEQVIIECVKVTPQIKDIENYVLNSDMTLSGILNERTYKLNISEIFYFEAIDEKVFAYTLKDVYEIKLRLYEAEQKYRDNYFIRCSKSFLINVMKIESISPALNGRFTAHMKNGENIIISRQYVKELKDALLGA